MARKAKRSGEQDSNQRAVDLDKLMDRMEEAARNGTREEAEAMLDQMQEMFENMRSAEEEESSPAEQAMRRELDELGKLLRDQQALRDETFRSDLRDRERRRGQRPARPPGRDDLTQPGDTGQSPDLDQGEASPTPDERDADAAARQLEQRQRALRERLEEMQKMLKSLGMKGEKGFGDAEKDMREAEGDLRGEKGQAGEGGSQGQPGRGRGGKGAAVDAQGRAIEALREGAQGLEKQMSQGQGQGRNGKRGYGARRVRPGDDPLGRGREEGNMGRDDGRLSGLGGATQRARKVMEELRRRLSDPNRPIEERDYLERLMRRD
jgi:hypothetical protein